MGRKVFISFLGTGSYEPVEYSFNGQLCSKTNFVALALMEKLCAEWTADDIVYIVCTSGEKGSYEKRWKGSDGGPAMEQILKQRSYPMPVSMILLPDGAEDDPWMIFDQVYELLQKEDEIVFDVTHAFRSIPLFTTALLDYSRYMKNTSVKGIYYGVLGKNYIQDLSAIARLQQYTEMASSLSSFGRIGQIGSGLENEVGAKDWTGAIDKLDRYITANRVVDIKQGNYKKILEENKKAIRKAMMPNPIRAVLDRLLDELDGFSSCDSNTNIEAAIEWAIKYKMIPQAYTMGLEYIITCVADLIKNVNPYEGKEARDFVSSLLSISQKDVDDNNFRGGLHLNGELVKILLNLTWVKQLRPNYQGLNNHRIEVDHGKGKVTFEKLYEDLDTYYHASLEIVKEASSVNLEDIS